MAEFSIDERLRFSRERRHILVGLQAAQQRWREVLEMVSEVDGYDEARQLVAQRLGLDDAQARAILDTQFRRLVRDDVERIANELREQDAEIHRLCDAETN